MGVLFVPLVHFGSFYSSPEIALVIGNLLAYLTGPKTNPLLTLKRAELLSTDTYEFVFASDAPLSFRPGQYMEWTLPHTREDSRGNRRFFTLSSAPDQGEVRMGVKFYPKPSTFKQRLLALQPGETDRRLPPGGRLHPAARPAREARLHRRRHRHHPLRQHDPPYARHQRPA